MPQQLPTPAPLPAAPRLREDALDWFVRRRNEDFGVDEEQVFQDWLRSDPAHRDAFSRWQGEWQAFDDVPADMLRMLQSNLARDLDSQAAGTTPSKAVNLQAGKANTTSGRPRRRGFVPAFAIAACAIAVVVPGVLAWNHWQAQPVYTHGFSSQRGQQLEVPLPDGSQMRLDTSTRVEVAYYRDRREVTLQDGQAVFAVRRDAERPFLVLAGSTRVTVVGTRFAVRYTPNSVGDRGVHVAVEEGRVRVERAIPGQGPEHALKAAATELLPGQQVTADAAGALSTVAAIPATGIAPWRENRVRFDNTRLDHALAELARYRDTRLQVRDPSVAALRITGVFDPRDVTTFQRVLPMSLPVRLRTADGATEILAK